MKKKVLVIYYSQTGQLKYVIDNFIKDLYDEEILVDIRSIKPKKKYPFPWPFYQFFDELPESVYLDGCKIEKIEDIDKDYDLVIIGYTVWYMSPSIPIAAFMKSEQAKKILKNKPVVTLVACRDMWILAQEKMKKMLKNIGAVHIDNVVLTDRGGSVASLVTLPRFLWTGKKNAFLFFPPAGIDEKKIEKTSRFGKRLKKALKNNEEKRKKPLLKNLGAVSVNGKLIATEKIANRSFKFWGKLIKIAGKKYSIQRKIIITIYFIFLLSLIFTVVPLNIIIRKIVYPFQKDKIKAMEKYYELPSGR